ncbi:hypothetical protein [Kutzneria sp. NPDC052558]|uniref:hypothetical protein n=1 Tax=Kutzneria sp. NPDC052558 TaxID=3364121 RepID=UPI0037C6DC3F
MNTKRRLLPAAAVVAALGMSLLTGGAANAVASQSLSPQSVWATAPCNGDKEPITDNFGNHGTMLCWSHSLEINFGGGNIENVVIGVLGSDRPIYADGGSGWHHVGNGYAETNGVDSPGDIGLFLTNGNVVHVRGTDDDWYYAIAYPDSSWSDWHRGW